MKKLFFVIAITAFSISVYSQDSTAMSNTYSDKNKGSTYHENPTLDKKLIWSIGIEPSTPIGHFHDYAKFGFGASLQAELKAGRTVGITLNGGYVAYGGKTVNSFKYSSFKYWPVMGGLKVYMGKAYIHGQAGPGFGEDGIGTSFWYGAGLGINFTKRVDAELRYMGWHQQTINGTNEGNNGGGGVYGNGGTGGNGGNGGTGGTGGGYGGHYSTIGLRVAVNF